jgi:hypothetical protein
VKVSIGKSEKKTYLDEEQKNKKFLPGPGAYISPGQISSLMDVGAPKIVRDYYDSGLPNAWFRSNDATPGPAAYTVDQFTRDERMKRGQKAIPALARALMMTIPEAIKKNSKAASK